MILPRTNEFHALCATKDVDRFLAERNFQIECQLNEVAFMLSTVPTVVPLRICYQYSSSLLDGEKKDSFYEVKPIKFLS